MKEKLKIMFPKCYYIWHKIRVKNNEKKEIKKKAAYDKYGHEILRDLYEMVYEKDYDILCYYGTLLGLVRDNRLIPWDDDLDFIILDKPDFSWRKLEADMKEYGFSLYRTIENERTIIGQSYKKRGVLCDFSLKHKGNGIENVLYGCYEIPGIKYIDGEYNPYQYWIYQVPGIQQLEEKVLADVKVKIPRNYLEILAAYYGENWKTPDPKFKPTKVETEAVLKITYHR